MKKPKIELTKVAVAQRQLDAAIKMLFMGIDELAVHSVAGAGLKLIQELHRGRGRDPLREIAASGMLTTINQYLNGIQQPPFIDSHLANICQSLTIEEKALLKSPEYRKGADLIAVTGDMRASWSELLKSVNFLKHASRDSDKLLDSDDVDNTKLLTSCVAAYTLLGLPLTATMKAFNYYWFYKSGDTVAVLKELDPEIGIVVEALRKLSEEGVKRACLKLIDIESIPKDFWLKQ